MREDALPGWGTLVRLSSTISKKQLHGRVVYEKQYLTDDWGGTPTVIRSRALRECNLIQQLHSSQLFGKRLGLMRIAECDPYAATIATYEVPGRNLGMWLRDPAHRRNLMLPCYLAGRWLRRFQSLPLCSEAFEQFCDHDPASMVEYCDRRLSTLRDFGYFWPDHEQRSRILQVIERLEQTVAASERVDVWVHADFAPGNLMWGKGRLTPIDFAMARAGQPLDDATYLIHRLEMLKIYRPWRRFPLHAYRRAILRGLGREEAFQTPAYQLQMLKHLICRLHTYARRPAQGVKQALHDKWVRAVVRHRLGQKVNEAQRRFGPKP